MMATMSSRVMSRAAAQVRAVFVILSAEVVEKVALIRSSEWWGFLFSTLAVWHLKGAGARASG
jgi:hypothetical protein